MRTGIPRRSLLALLPAGTLAACAPPAVLDAGPAPARFAAALAALDTATGALLGRIGEQESQDDLEVAAVAYATGRPGRRPGPLPTAAAAHAMEPMLVALAVHGRRLAAMDGPPPEPGERNTAPGAAELIREAERGLSALRATTGRAMPDADRRRAMAALQALRATPEAGSTADAYLAARQPQVNEAAAYLRAVLGTQEGQGLRGALEARTRDHLRAEEALLGAARGDRALSVMERYALFHRVAGAQSDLPGQLQLVALMAEAFRLMPDAHAAIARPDAASAPEFQAFLAAAAAVQQAATPAAAN